MQIRSLFGASVWSLFLHDILALVGPRGLLTIGSHTMKDLSLRQWEVVSTPGNEGKTALES